MRQKRIIKKLMEKTLNAEIITRILREFHANLKNDNIIDPMEYLLNSFACFLEDDEGFDEKEFRDKVLNNKL
jgi:hypothetical protein